MSQKIPFRDTVGYMLAQVCRLHRQRADVLLNVKLDTALNALDDVNQNNDVAAINSLQALSSLNHCLRAMGRALGPTGESDVWGSARKDVLFGAALVYTVAVRGPTWKSSQKP